MAEIREFPGPVLKGIIVALFVGIALMVATLFFYRFNDAATAADQKKLQERGDCRATIRDRYDTARLEMEVAKARLDQTYIDAQLIVRVDPTQVQALADQLDMLTNVLDEKISVVENLKPSQALVEKRCPQVN